MLQDFSGDTSQVKQVTIGGIVVLNKLRVYNAEVRQFLLKQFPNQGTNTS